MTADLKPQNKETTMKTKQSKKDRSKARRARKPIARRAVKRQRSMKHRFEKPVGDLPPGNYETKVKDVQGDTATLATPTPAQIDEQLQSREPAVGGTDNSAQATAGAEPHDANGSPVEAEALPA